MMEMNMLAGSRSSLDKSLSLLVQVLEGERDSGSLQALAEAEKLPLSTAYRLMASLERAGLVAQLGPNRYMAGATLRRLAGFQLSPRRILTEIGRPILTDLSRRTGRITHLGVLDENMTTYLVKEGDRAGRAISGPDMQLEAYCSGIGKALLAHLSTEELDTYLATAPFVALTPRTIISAEALREELANIRQHGYAIDHEEMFEGFICIAVPIQLRGQVVAAISLVVTQNAGPYRPIRYLSRLLVAAAQIEMRLCSVSEVFMP
jgi:DNA-binding IclR family transcriptional regulator